VTPNSYQPVDLVRVRQEYPDMKRTVINFADKWQPMAILIEDKSSGQALLQDLMRDTKLPCLAITPTLDKQTRARAQSAQIEGKSSPARPG
jgi:phage terminase large subunit-like protein